MPNPIAVLPFFGGAKKCKTALGLATLGSQRGGKMGSKMTNPSAVLPFFGVPQKSKTALGLATLGSKKEVQKRQNRTRIGHFGVPKRR